MNKVAIHHKKWFVGSCIQSGGPSAWSLVQAVISYNFTSDQISCCQKTIWYLVQLQWLKLSVEPRTTFAAEELWILTSFNEKWVDTSCLISWALSKWWILQGRIDGLCICRCIFFLFVYVSALYSLVNPFNWKHWCLAQSICLISAD